MMSSSSKVKSAHNEFRSRTLHAAQGGDTALLITSRTRGAGPVRWSYVSNEGVSTGLAATVSSVRQDERYTFVLAPQTWRFLDGHDKGYIVLGLLDQERAFKVPVEVVRKFLTSAGVCLHDAKRISLALVKRRGGYAMTHWDAPQDLSIDGYEVTVGPAPCEPG